METRDSHYNSFKYDLCRFGDSFLSSAFSNKYIMTGVRNALFVTKIFTESSDVLLYRKNDNGEYDLCLNALMVKNNYKNDNNWINVFVNRSKFLFEDQTIRNIDCSDISNDHSLALIPLFIDASRYVVVIRNCSIRDNKNYKMFIDKFSNDMRIILYKVEEYKKMLDEGFKDKLTHLDNRNAYENDIKILDEEDENYYYILLDLFRLKYINDNYDYAHGDAYIIKAAEILNKYFAKYYNYKDNHGLIIETPTGSCVYRIGGDEFVIIDKRDSIDVINNKLKYIREEVSNIDLDVEENLYLGINYGIALRKNNETVKEIAKLSGNELKLDKEAMYNRLGIERRKQIVKVK